MTYPSPSRASRTAIVAVLLVMTIAIPAGTAIAVIGDVVRETAAEQRALEELERLHALPDVIEYVPPAPWYEDELAPEGPTYELADVPTNQIIMSNPAPMDAIGTAKVVSLAIEFTDVTHAAGNSVSALQGRLTGTNSMKSYYSEVSYGNLTVAGTAHGWYEAPETMAYYGKPEGGNHDSYAFHELVREAVLAADSTVDFSQYDTNHDRIIDSICLVHAGHDQATGGGSNAIWSKQSVYPGTLRVDGVYVGYYFTVSEYSPVGVYVHEFGHILGLPDLYDTDYSSVGVGDWDVMGSGAWNNWGVTPGHLSAWCKVYLGWIIPTTISNFVEGRRLNYMEGGAPEVIKLPTQSSKEYFLLENRYQSGYDRYLPGSGLLIWHIDSSVISQWLIYNRVNNVESRKGVDLEEASGTQDLDTYGSNSGDNNDPWKSSAVGFTPDSIPNSRLYDGTDTKIRVFNISAASTVMIIDIDFGGDSYAVIMDTITTSKEAAPGQTVLYNVTVGTRSSVGDTVRLTLLGADASWGFLESRFYTLVLGPKGTTLVQLKVTPPAGTPKGTNGEIVLRARSDASGLTTTLETITVVLQVHLLSPDPPSKTVKVMPGTSEDVDITITNSGNGLENLTLSLEADRIYWGSVSPRRVSIGILGTGQVRVTFSVPQGVLAGEEEDFELTLLSEVISASEAGEMITLVPIMHIPLTMIVEEQVSLRWGGIYLQSVLPGGMVDYELTLFNEGNSQVDVLIGYMAPGGWTFEVEDGVNITIPAFGLVILNATVTAAQDADAGSTVVIDLSAAKGLNFFYASMAIDVDQLYRLTVSGQSDKFGDPGVPVTFNLTVTNTGNGLDQVSVNIVGNGWDSEVRPTMIQLGVGDGESSQPVQVIVTSASDAKAFEEGTVTVVFTSDNGEDTASFSVTLTVNPITSFSLDMESLVDTIDPANPSSRKATFELRVENLGNQDDLFHVGLVGLPVGWTSEFPNRMLSLGANQLKTLEFTVVPPEASSTAAAGTIGFSVQVASELRQGEPQELPLQVVIKANRGHSIGPLEPTYIAPSGSKLTFRVLVVNEGNVPEVITLTAVGEVESFSYEVREVTLEPFGQKVVNITVELPSTSEDKTVQMSVIATTKDVTLQRDSPVFIEVQGKPSAPGPVLVAALAALGIAAVVAVGGRRRS